MHLLIDIGNTRMKWALYDPAVPLQVGQEVWHAQGEAAHAMLEDALTRAVHQAPTLRQIVYANVAGRACAAAVQATLTACAARVPCREWHAAAQWGALRNGYRTPERLGADRFAALLGAQALLPQTEILVACCGTATTIDALDAHGLFRGGMILPGLQLMAHSLSHHTAQLPAVLADPHALSSTADHTEAAIASGCVLAQVGALHEAYHAACAQGRVPQHVLLSGGAAQFLLPHVRVPVLHHPNLVLTGLAVVAQSL